MIILEDESLRDGLQFEKKIFSLEEKLQIFEKLSEAGLSRIQVGSFVHPEIVPQMADTDELIRRIGKHPGVLLTGLVLNAKGLERALLSGLKHISLSCSASDLHSLKNVKKTRENALALTVDLIREAVLSGLSVRAGVQCSFGCVYQGQVDEDLVFESVGKMADAGAHEFNMADTAGMANPQQVKRMIERLHVKFPEQKFSLHLHDTRGLALANMFAGYQAGVRIFDTSAGGLGGCPFVKGAAGNIPTEDAVNMFSMVGEETGIDLQKICKVTSLYQKLLGRELPGRLCKIVAAEESVSR